MIHKKGILRKALGGLLVALVALSFGQVQAQTTATAGLTWGPENGAGTNDDGLARLNTLIGQLEPENIADSPEVCVTLSGTFKNVVRFPDSAKGTCKAGQGAYSGNSIPDLEHVQTTGDSPGPVYPNYEDGASQPLVLTFEHSKLKSEITINVSVANVDEPAATTQTEPATYYLRPGASNPTPLLVSNLFKDPDGHLVSFNQNAATSTDVYVCDHADAGNTNQTPSTRPVIAETTPFGVTGAGDSEGCSVSNTTTGTTNYAGGPGNRVLSTTRTGPVLSINVHDTLQAAASADATPVDRPAGTYGATVWVRAWSGIGDDAQSSNFAVFNVVVKVGANNHPQFPGGSTGFTATLKEGPTSKTEAMSAWYPNDFDTSTAAFSDKLKITLSASATVPTDKLVVENIAGDKSKVTLVVTDPDPSAEPAVAGALALHGTNLDYETKTEFTVYVHVTDNWLSVDGEASVSVPIKVTVTDQNELIVTEAGDMLKKEGLKLVLGDSETVNLATYFKDPEDPDGDALTFNAYPNVGGDDVVKCDDAGMCTVTGVIADSEGETSTRMVTLTATDGKLHEEITFPVITRKSSIAPSIDIQQTGTLSIGMSVPENPPKAGTELSPKIVYTDDAADEKATTMLVDLDYPSMVVDHFTAAVDKDTGAKRNVTITATDKVNFEARSHYRLGLYLIDKWDPTKDSRYGDDKLPLVIEISVNDRNDAPKATEDKITEQSVVVKGSKSMDVSSHFTDEDKGFYKSRLIVSAMSSDATKVAVSVTGLANVHFSGVAEGMATITLTADDTKGGTITKPFDVKVSANNEPMVNADVLAMQLPSDSTINIGEFHDMDLSGIFSEPDEGDSLNAITASSADDSKLLAVSTGENMVVLAGRASGDVDLTISTTDQAGNPGTTTATITVNAAPEEAMPIDGVQMLTRVDPWTMDVMGVFSDSDDGVENLTISAEVLDEGAMLANATVDGFVVTLDGVGLGDFEVKLTATDPHGATATSVFAATVENIEPVVAMAVEDMTSNRVDDLPVDLSATFTDRDEGGEDFMPTITATAEGEAEVELTVDGTDLSIDSISLGTTIITLTAADADGGMVDTTFELTVENILPVVAMAPTAVMTNRVDDKTVPLGAVFTDRDGGDDFMPTITYAIDNNIAKLSIEGSTLSIDALTLGTAMITLEATDADGGMVSTMFELTVDNVAPVVAMSVEDKTITRIDDLTVDLSGVFSDKDGGDMFMPAIMATSQGDAEVAITVDGLSVMVDAIGLGSTTITIVATDADGAMVETTFMLTIENIVPVVMNEVPAQTTTRVADLSIDISETFMDPDHGALAITAMSSDGEVVDASVANTTLTLDGTGLGNATVTLTAMDPDGGSVSTTFAVTIENIDPVVAMSVPDQTTTRIQDLSIDISGVFSDEDATNGLTITAIVADGSVVSATVADHMLAISGLSVGDTTITLRATDMDGAMVETTFKVDIMNIEPVVANAVADQTTTRVEDLNIDLTNTFSDADNDALSLVAMTADGTILDVELTGTSLVIRGLAVGDTSVTLTATDAIGDSVETMFNVTVMNVAPTAVASLSPVTLEVGGESVSQAIGGLFADDGDPLTYTVTMGNSGIASGAISGTSATFGAVSRGSTTATVTAMDPHGGEVSVSASVTVGDGELKAVAAKSLAGFGRALLASVSSSVGSRLMTDARSTDLTLDAWAPADQDDTQIMSLNETSDNAWNVVNAVNSTDVSTSTVSTAGLGGGVNALQSVVGNQFALNLGTSDNPSQWSVWGNLDRQSYEGTGYDGMASNVYLGVDVTAGECWMFGVAVASNSGESDYSYGTATQTMDMSLTTVLPYVSYKPSDRTSLWGVAGFGSGELDTTVVGASNDVSDLSANLTMIGGRQHLTSTGRMDLALRADAAIASIETDSGDGAADGLMADVNRIRAGLEGSFTTDTGQGGTLTPFGQVSLRSDGGDGDTGTGIEISGGVRMASDVFTLEVRGRTLAMHSADDYSESGFSLMATLNPSASATGVSVTLAPRWGADAQGSDMLWQDTVSVNSMQSYGVLTGFGNDGSTKSLETKIGYGMLVANERYLLTPFVDLGMSDSQRQEVLVGATLRQMIRGDADLDVSFALGRVEERTGDSNGKIGLNATLRF